MMALIDPPDSRGKDTRALIMFRLDSVRLVNGLNSREHWAARARRAKAQRAAAKLATMTALRNTTGWFRGVPDETTVAVTIQRVGPRRMDDDGLAASAKHVRDGVADALGIDDGSPRIAWTYEQVKGKAGVVVVIRVQA